MIDSPALGWGVQIDRVEIKHVVMAEHPAALQLRLLETVFELAAERNSTLALPLPVELLCFLERETSETATRDATASTPSQSSAPIRAAPHALWCSRPGGDQRRRDQSVTAEAHGDRRSASSLIASWCGAAERGVAAGLLSWGRGSASGPSRRQRAVHAVGPAPAR
jgi:hypothetical protein